MKYKIMKYRPLFAFISVFLMVCGTAAQTRIYLSPQGNDANNGTEKAPLFSLQAALKKVVSTTRRDTAYIEVAAGDYYMQEGCCITSPTSRPIVVRGKGKARFIGGERITNWERKTHYKAYIAKTQTEEYTFEQFYINDRRATLARTPNDGFYKVGEVTETIVSEGNSTKESFAGVSIKGEDDELKKLEHVWPGRNGQPKISLYHKWSNTKMHIGVINKRDYSINFGSKRLSPLNNVTEHTPYYIYDYAHALDTAGEWYMNYDDGYLTYIPLRGENPDKATCIIPTLKRWILFKGSENGAVENISFENLVFSVSQYNIPTEGFYPSQGGEALPAAIEMSHTKNIVFNGCEFEKTGAYALWFKEGCHNNKVTNCYLHDLGAGGIRIGVTTYKEGERVTSGCVIDNNIIRDGGKEIAEGIAILLHHTAGNQVTHNDISHFYYSGISMGWKWGYGKSPACNNTIAYNHIHNLGKGLLSDLGGIYTLSEGTGNSITNNVIHDITAGSYGGWGIYTDEGSSNITIKNNLVYRCHDGGFHQHYGKNNIVENNIFAFGDNCQIQTSRAEEHNSFTFRRNIILQEKGNTAEGKWFSAKMIIGKNLYWSYGNELSFCGTNRSEWVKKREKDALFANPMMVAPLQGDFTFKSTYNIKKTGFTPFDYKQAGVYGSDEWKRKAVSGF